MDVVERHRFGDVLNDVQNVVHAVDQLMDLVAVERGDERGVELGQGIVGDLVGLALNVVDRIGMLCRVGRGIDQRPDQVG